MNGFEQAIQAYLENYAQNDSEFATKYANPDKSIAECCDYIVSEMEKLAKESRNGQNAVALHPSDEEVYGLAVHYYDETDLKVIKATTKHIATAAEVPYHPTPKPRTQKAPKRAAKVNETPAIPELDIPDFSFPIF